MTEPCMACGAPTDWDHAVECGHTWETYCDSVCARFGCGECHDEHIADMASA